MSYGYGMIRIEGVEGDDEAVRDAVREICALVAESDSELGYFEIEIEMIDIVNTQEASA